MQTSTADQIQKPDNGKCKDCNRETLPRYREAVRIAQECLPPRWFAPNERCDECLLNAQEQQKKLFMLKREKERLDKAFKEANISPRFRERTFANFKKSETNANAYSQAIRFDPTQDKGLVFLGPCGTGKTHLAAAIANRELETGRMPVLFISCPDLLITLRQTMHGKGNLDALDASKRVSLLIIDDIGAEKPTEWVREILFVLINHRYEMKLPTIFTTNLNMSQHEEKLGERIVSRIFEMTTVIRMSGEDFRMKPQSEG